MKKKVPARRCFQFILLAFLFAGLYPPARGSDPTADDILARVRSTFSGIKDYAVNVRAEIDMENVRVPPMKVEIYFKQPDKIRMKSKGFAMLPKQGIFLNPNRLSGENFYMALLGKEMLGQTEAYIIELVPRKEKIKARKLTVWVDSEKWIPVRVHTLSQGGQTAKLEFEYALLREKFWLPTRIVAKLNMAGFKGFPTRHRRRNNESDKNEPSKPAEGRMTIEYSDYRINTGLPDSLFEKEIKHNVR